MSEHSGVFNPSDDEVPSMLSAAWMVCSPADTTLKDQLNSAEKAFLVLFAEYIETALASPLSNTDPAATLSDILMTARHRYSQLSKETSLSSGHVAILALLHLLKNLFSADNMKYQSMESFLEVYPAFKGRVSTEQEKLFHTANWMHILFKITTAKKNKGLVMIVIPKFVEGNGVQYVTGSGQTQPTKDRVSIYETEGEVTPVKRLHRKIKKDEAEVVKKKKSNKKNTYKKPTYEKKKRLSELGKNSHKEVVVRVKSTRITSSVQDTYDYEDEINQGLPMDDYAEHIQSSTTTTRLNETNSDNISSYLPLPVPFSLAPPIPVRRSQSSFSEAAAFIASANQTGPTNAPSSYLKSPREFYLDVEANGTIRKSSSATWGSVSLTSPRGNGVSEYDDQLQMLREVSEDSDFSGVSGHVEGIDGVSDINSMLPPHLVHQPSLTINLLTNSNTVGTGGQSLGSPNPQPRTLERFNSASLDEQGEVDLDLLEKVLRQGSGGGEKSMWLNRSSSTSSLAEGRDSSLAVSG